MPSNNPNNKRPELTPEERMLLEKIKIMGGDVISGQDSLFSINENMSGMVEDLDKPKVVKTDGRGSEYYDEMLGLTGNIAAYLTLKRSGLIPYGIYSAGRLFQKPQEINFNMVGQGKKPGYFSQQRAAMNYLKRAGVNFKKIPPDVLQDYFFGPKPGVPATATTPAVPASPANPLARIRYRWSYKNPLREAAKAATKAAPEAAAVPGPATTTASTTGAGASGGIKKMVKNLFRRGAAPTATATTARAVAPNIAQQVVTHGARAASTVASRGIPVLGAFLLANDAVHAAIGAGRYVHNVLEAQKAEDAARKAEDEARDREANPLMFKPSPPAGTPRYTPPPRSTFLNPRFRQD